VEHDLDVGRRRRRQGLAAGSEDRGGRCRIADGLVLDVGRGGVLELGFVFFRRRVEKRERKRERERERKW